MTDVSSPGPMTPYQAARREALQTARDMLAQRAPMGGNLLPDYRSTGELVDLARFILDGTDPLESWMAQHPAVLVPALADDEDPGDPAFAMYQAAQTILQTGGTVEIHGVVIRRAEDPPEHPGVTEQFLNEVLAERLRQWEDLGYGTDHDARHTRGEWANLVTDYVAKAMDDPDAHVSRERLVQAAALLAAWAETLERQPQPSAVHARQDGPNTTWCGVAPSTLPDGAHTGRWVETTCPDCKAAAPEPVRRAHGWDA